MGWKICSKTPETISSHVSVPDEHGDETTKARNSWLQRHTTGWRFGMVACALSATAVFLINLIVFIRAEQQNGTLKVPFEVDGKHSLYNGSCNMTRRLNTGIHLLINLLSTILLGASNYCMQCMSAPTRKEVDLAHARKKWLDIGVLSLRNLSRISRKRVTLYWLLGFSSLPLHLFYNSTVFESIAANDYMIFSVNEAFTDVNYSNYTPYAWEKTWATSAATHMFNQSKAGKLERLEPAECLDEYAKSFQTARGSLLLVAPDTSVPEFNRGDAALWFEFYEHVPTNGFGVCPFEWMCNDPTRFCNDPAYGMCEYRLGSARNNISSWRPFHKEVLYCLSETTEEHCALKYSVHLILTVILLNAFKAIIMTYLALGVVESPLMTIGDAISSFLRQPDATTKEMCLASKDDFSKRGWKPIVKPYCSVPQKRFAAASKIRWTATIGLCLLAILIVLSLLIYGILQIRGPRNISVLVGLGLGAINPSTFIKWRLPSDGASGIVLNVLVANSAQVILSVIYFTYNALFTSMSLAAEFSRFASHRKGLRISAVPCGDQRSTYFLQLPYRVAIPLLSISVLLHWLVSQSIFLVAVDPYVLGGQGAEAARYHRDSTDYMTCGYSPAAMMAVITGGIFMIIIAVVSGFGKLTSGMAVAGSCSAAISAACHTNRDHMQDDTAFRKVHWGVVKVGENNVGHCGFSDKTVEEPVEGGLYAGFWGKVGEAYYKPV